jgi:hypothetical protein
MGQLSLEPLRQLFQELVEKNYSVLGLRDEAVTEYIAVLLEEFASTRNLYRIRNIAGRPLHSVGEMLMESNPVYGEAGSFDREREVRKHIGDFTLFFTGMFPESLGRRRGADSFINYISAGKESYHIVSEFDRMRPHPNAPDERGDYTPSEPGPLFAFLSDQFERCMYGLNLVKSELESFQDPLYQEVKRLLT